MRLLAPALLLMMIACPSPRPEAPPLADRDGGVADAGPAALDTGLPGNTDGGSGEADAGEVEPPNIPPARVDAGYTPEVPEPPPADACEGACGQGECQEDCWEMCTLVSHALGGEQRTEFLECLEGRDSCEAEGCIPRDPEVTSECETVCGLQAGEPDPNLEPSRCAGLDEDPATCLLECNASLSIMAPAAQQAWLHCSLDQCRANPDQECDVEAFLSPTPSQACIDTIEHIDRCEDESGSPTWGRAHTECELYRSPAEQRDLGGDAWVECLANTQVCGDWVYIECLSAMEAATGRGAAVREMCDPVSQCDEGLGYQCRIWGQGLTGLVGGYAIEQLRRCLDDRRDDCGGMSECLEQLVDRPAMTEEDPCIAHCNRCQLPGSVCGAMCVRVRNSLSVRDAERLHGCMENAQCGLDMLTRCSREVLPRTVRTCERFLEASQARCPRAFEAPATVYAPWCALGGVRTGYLTEEAMMDCAERIPCVDEDFSPLSICLQGLPR